MAQTKTPLGERDTNVAPKQPARGKKASATTDKSNASPPQPSLEHVANNITKTHGQKRAREDDQAAQPAASNEIGPSEEDLNNVSDDGDSSPGPLIYNCNQVRSKINALVRSGEIKIGEFQKELGVSATAWGSFMKQSGPEAGQYSSTYDAAHDYFVKREKKGIKIPPAKKAKTTSSSSAANNTDSGSGSNSKSKDDKYDISDVTLDGKTSSGRAPIYDTCDDLRTKINAYLKEPGNSQAGLGRALTSVFESAGGSDKNQKVTAAQIKSFLNKKGPRAGATSGVYYAGYVFFEKVRVKQGKTKTKKRTEMEEKHGPDGCPTDADSSTPMMMMADEVMSEDKYGVVTFSKLPPGASLTRSRRK